MEQAGPAMTVQKFALEQIVANPFQTRQAEDPADVARLAESIAQVGLLQVPVGRRRDGRVQLAFGHTRLAAFRQLALEDPRAYGEMPVDERDLSDIELFELAVRENLERRDLTPIEEARAMATYRDTFGKTSDEIGELFGKSGSAARNTMRLLNLPMPVQEKMQSREINESTGRKLLVLQKMAPQAIPDIAKVITGKERAWRSVDEEIQSALEEAAHPLPAGRDGWWPLDWKGTVEPPAPADWLKRAQALEPKSVSTDTGGGDE
jgi:ParB family chromosome partitioning protein